MALKELNDQNFKQELKAAGIAVVDVYAAWCGSCRLFASTFEASSNENPEFNYFKIDGDINQEFAGTIEIDNLPFVAVFKDGEYIGGKSTTKKEGLEGMIQKIKEKL
ncbi:thioredoxin family protein [bacterium]|nr:thioredoxin family protein [bacterium]